MPRPIRRVMTRLSTADAPGRERWIERTTGGTAAAQVNTTGGTFCTLTVGADGRGTVEIRRRREPSEPSQLLARVEWNDEDAERGANMTAQARLAPGVVVERGAHFDFTTNDGAF